MHLVLFLVYPLLVLGRLLNRLLGRDPLRLREPKDATCWIERAPDASLASYFSEGSEPEGRAHGGLGRMATIALGWVARRLAPPRRHPGQAFRALDDRDADIPDEVYTLW